MTKWTINESIKSQLNISINNKNPSKDKLEIKLYSNKDAKDLDIPVEYKDWVLEKIDSKKTEHGKIFITATYKKKKVEEEVEDES